MSVRRASTFIIATLIVAASVSASPLAEPLASIPPIPPVALGLLPDDPWLLLPSPLAAGLHAATPQALHDAQAWFLADAGAVSPLAGEARSFSLDAELDELFRVLALPRATHAETLSAAQGLDPQQADLVAEVIGAYLAALAAPDPFAARGHFAGLATGLLAALPSEPGPLLADVCGVLFIDLSHTDNDHACDYLLLLDAGGNDTYRNNAGGSITATGANSLYAGMPALAVDLGGDDLFLGRAETGGVAGGGHGGAAALVTLSGDDVFDTRIDGEGAVNGGGHRGGVGLLVAGPGDRSYRGSVGHGGVNGGAGFGGVGLLLDVAGNDSYWGFTAVHGGVNGGSNDGYGMLVDLGGDDDYDGYVSVRGGVNGGNEQGVSVLYDASGDDTFDGSVDGGGVNGGTTDGSAWFIVGGGENRYSGEARRHGGVNGAAKHGQALFLSLGAGSDRYDGRVGRIGAVNGAAMGGTALLIDEGGDDHYEGRVRGSGAVNGAAVYGAARLEVLGAGDDTYIAAVLLEEVHEITGVAVRATNGGAHLGLGALVDHGGQDRYRENDGPWGVDATIVPKGDFGMQVDLPLGLPP